MAPRIDAAEDSDQGQSTKTVREFFLQKDVDLESDSANVAPCTPATKAPNTPTQQIAKPIFKVAKQKVFQGVQDIVDSDAEEATSSGPVAKAQRVSAEMAIEVSIEALVEKGSFDDDVLHEFLNKNTASHMTC